MNLIQVLYFITVYYAGKSTMQKNNLAWPIAMILLNPHLLLIDHGHFQYNCISLGLTVAAIAAIFSDRDVIGSVFFSLALNHKQMSAYFAPAFLAISWGNVLLHLAPFERGIYEDYVANFWCSTSIIVKWKRLFTMQSLKLLSLAATISTCLPSMTQMALLPRQQSFLYGLLNSALSFYLFSFQVHEKSILLPLLPASLLALEEPFVFKWLTCNALLSMFPLLSRDKLVPPYIAL